MTDPKLYFAIDNCFASKRWTEPDEWAEVIANLGIRYVEVSADTECDPLYMGEAYTASWREKTAEACAKHGLAVANLYSGHGTYSTLGLAHWDSRVRDRFRDQWIKKQMDTAKVFQAGMGFFAHAFDQRILQSPAAYQESYQELLHNLEEIAQYARTLEMPYVGVEQMYSPHQVPWTVEGAATLMRSIYAVRGNPFYITIDVGHMSGQRNFTMPDKERLMQAIQNAAPGAGCPNIWLGAQKNREIFWKAVNGEMQAADAVSQILKNCGETPYLFAEPCDGSPYHWLEQLGCYAPIVHLQQTDGKSSPHWPFDEAHNQKGIIHGYQVLKSLAKSYETPARSDMPPRCEKIVLTLEPFIGTGADPYIALEGIRRSVDYWRTYLPRDGMHLSELLQHLEHLECEAH